LLLFFVFFVFLLERGGILFAIFHLILSHYVYTRIFMTLGQTFLGEKFVLVVVVVVGDLDCNCGISFGPRDQDLGF
jgi:hypothetical protein